MSLRNAIGVIAGLANEGVLSSYAIAGAVAALNYIQPTLTEDLDILVSIDGLEKTGSGLLLLSPLERALSARGYDEKTGLGFRIEGWPVQFLPVASPLDSEALDQAVDIEFTTADKPKLTARCLRAEHVVATAVKLGRLKDLARVQAFLNEGAVDLIRLKAVLERHNLLPSWLAFCAKAGIANPL